jgi:flavin-dependent dehydrogenase
MLFYDAVIIGGGPSGSTVGTLLARAGRRVALIEQERFPRFHIGESLLPATTPIFARLGVLQQLRDTFLTKPGGKWFVGSGAWVGDFSVCDPRSSFASSPYAFCVERSRFDRILLENARSAGVEIFQPARVQDVTFDGERVTGLQVTLENGDAAEFEAGHVFDCSGRSALIARKLRLVQPTDLGRLALYSHYHGVRKDPELAKGWFVGQMVSDGWCWAIPLENEKISVGLVFAASDFYSSGIGDESYFLKRLEQSGFLERVLEPGYTRSLEVLKTANVGYSSRKLYGPGWTSAGDAGFFVDPCFSSGVHLAMFSGELAAQLYLEGGSPEKYETELRREETSVTWMVKHFYNVSRFPRLQKISARISNRSDQVSFNTFIGGDFNLDPNFARRAHDRVARVIDAPLSP